MCEASRDLTVSWQEQALLAHLLERCRRCMVSGRSEVVVGYVLI